MPRIITVNAPGSVADVLVDRIRPLQGVLGYSRHSGASVEPPGDVLELHVTTHGARQVFEALDELRVTEHGTVLTSTPGSFVARTRQRQLDSESNETTWEEMAFLLRRDTNLSVNFLSQMFLAGTIAASGLWSNTLPVIVGAMVIAPAFEPLVRIPFGLITGVPGMIRRGALTSACGYAALLIGALCAAFVLRSIDPAAGAEFSGHRWVQYFSGFNPAGLLASVAGAAAGAIVVAGVRSVLTTGVMITLALIPSVAVAGAGIALGDLALAGMGLARCATDAALVLLVSGLVLAAKQRVLHRRRAIA